LDRGSSPLGKAAVMDRGSSLQETGKAAAMDRGSSPTRKAAVITRRRVVTAEGEGHQKQEAQSVNPSIGSIEAKYFGEGHERSVNSPVNKRCVSPALFSVRHRQSRVTRGTTISLEEEVRSRTGEKLNLAYFCTCFVPGDPKCASAKVDSIQHLSFDLRSMQLHIVVSQRVHPEKLDDSDSLERRGPQKDSTVNRCISQSDISPSRSSSHEKFKKTECVFPVDKEVEPQLLATFRFDNTPAACSSTHPLIRLSSLSNAEDHQVCLFSNGPDPSQVLDGFDAECSQADQCCTESNEKNSKEGKYKIAADFALKNESMENKEFKDTQHGEQENYESFVLPNHGAEFMKNEEDLEESRVEDRSNVRSGVDSDVSGDVKLQTGQKFCTTLYKLHYHNMRVEDQPVRWSGHLDSEMLPSRPSFNQEERKYAICIFILVGETFVRVHLWIEFAIPAEANAIVAGGYVLVGETKYQSIKALPSRPDTVEVL